MVLHELSTNAAKYGAFTKEAGRLSLRWTRENAGLAIVWQESNGPLVVRPSRLSYGTSLIRELIPFELGGTVDLGFAADGIKCRLAIPHVWVSWEDGPGEDSRETRKT
jgi:two-component sensor histidine kinase